MRIIMLAVGVVLAVVCLFQGQPGAAFFLIVVALLLGTFDGKG